MSMKAQREEFDAMDKLVKAYNRLSQTAIVDDDYPEMRYHYESKLAALLKAMTANGRFEKGNNYGVTKL